EPPEVRDTAVLADGHEAHACGLDAVAAERVDQLEEQELVVEVGLEPEDERASAGVGGELALALGEEPLYVPGAAPPASGEVPSTNPAQLGRRDRLHGPVVEHVGPGEDGAGDPGLAQGAGDGVTVGDMERPRRSGAGVRVEVGPSGAVRLAGLGHARAN